MKILIINPNSDGNMTGAIRRSAESFMDNRGEVFCLSTPGAPVFIETYGDQARAAAGMIQLVREHEKDTDAFVVACHCDPNLDLLKETTGRLVVGIGEASMKMASMLGHRFSVLSMGERSIPGKEALIRKYHLEGLAASVRAPVPEHRNLDIEQMFLETARLAVAEDGAEVIVLGCAGLTGMDKRIQEALRVPVLDGVICALILAEGWVRYGIATSKIRRYNFGGEKT